MNWFAEFSWFTRILPTSQHPDIRINVDTQRRSPSSMKNIEVFFSSKLVRSGRCIPGSSQVWQQSFSSTRRFGSHCLSAESHGTRSRRPSRVRLDRRATRCPGVLVDRNATASHTPSNPASTRGRCKEHLDATWSRGFQKKPSRSGSGTQRHRRRKLYSCATCTGESGLEDSRIHLRK